MVVEGDERDVHLCSAVHGEVEDGKSDLLRPAVREEEEAAEEDGMNDLLLYSAVREEEVEEVVVDAMNDHLCSDVHGEVEDEGDDLLCSAVREAVDDVKSVLLHPAVHEDDEDDRLLHPLYEDVPSHRAEAAVVALDARLPYPSLPQAPLHAHSLPV